MVAVPTLHIERAIFGRGVRRLAALDEVGRGALAGPVSVGAVVIDAAVGAAPLGLRDSKLLSPAARTRLVAPIREWVVGWAVGHAAPREIDRYGIVVALHLAARRALAALPGPVDEVLLDGNADYVTMPQPALADTSVPFAGRVTTIVKGDRDCASIAAASVLAKVERDGMMTDLGAELPAYGWGRNKGYGTAEHRAAIARVGVCDHHRRSWHLPGGGMPAAAVHGG